MPSLHRKRTLFFLATFLFACFSAQAFTIAFADVESEQSLKNPGEPLRIVVYTGPGGLIDVTARRLARILEAHDLPFPVVVENRPGGGGMVALSHVLSLPPDGRTVFALTSSVLSKALQAGKEKDVLQLHFLIRFAEDYESLIAHQGAPFSSLQELISLSKKQAERLIWAGPASGGTDHLFALKAWGVFGIQGKWIPYPSGSEAIAAVLGQHADVYVGNAQDTIGRADLRILGTAAPKRIERFPEAPTFSELGFPELTGEVLWRGFAVHGDTSPEKRKELIEILRLGLASPEWEMFLTERGVAPLFETEAAFQGVVQKQLASDTTYLSQGMDSHRFPLVLGIFLLVVVAAIALNNRQSQNKVVGALFNRRALVLISGAAIVLVVAPLLGFLTVSSFFILCTAFLNGYRRALPLFMLLVCWIALSFGVFEYLLSIPIEHGVLW